MTSKSLPQSFLSKKAKIISSLAVPTEEYDDLSPKGSVDEGIRELIDDINGREGWVTTSSCAGRISVFLEGKRSLDVGEGKGGEGEVEDGERTKAGVGGKGGGGRWLFVSHDPIPFAQDGEEGRDLVEKLGLVRRTERKGRKSIGNNVGARRFVHFKFEPMILHILTASPTHAQTLLSCAIQAGFRESGALNLIGSVKEQATPIVGVRSMGLSLESLVGEWQDEEARCTVHEEDLRTLLEISNERFKENTKRIERFRELLKKVDNGMDAGKEKLKGGDGGAWEDPVVRRERKRAEGLRKSQFAQEAKQGGPSEPEESPDLESLEQNT